MDKFCCGVFVCFFNEPAHEKRVSFWGKVLSFVRTLEY